jgi:hypothetical protein
MQNKKRPSAAGFLIVVVFAITLYLLMTNLPTGQVWLPDYRDWFQNMPTNLLYKIYWFIGDHTEAGFQKSFLGALLMIIFAALSYFLKKANPHSKLAGAFTVSYAPGNWPWVFAASTLGLFLSVFVFNYVNIATTPRGMEIGWVPTMIPVVSFPAAVVLTFGGNWATVLTGGILGGLIGCPLAWILLDKLIVPAGLHGVIANVTSMWVGTIVILQLCEHFPWIKKPAPANPSPDPLPDPSPMPPIDSASWFIRRVLADFTEGPFYGNELASVGLLLGCVISWFLNPAHSSYGSMLLPAILLSQFLASAIATYLYFGKWVEGGFPTFVPVFSVAPAVVLFFGGTPQSILAGAILGAVFCPPVAAMVNSRLPRGWCPVIGNTFSMGLCTAIVVTALKYLPFFGM